MFSLLEKFIRGTAITFTTNEIAGKQWQKLKVCEKFRAVFQVC